MLSIEKNLEKESSNSKINEIVEQKKEDLQNILKITISPEEEKILIILTQTNNKEEKLGYSNLLQIKIAEDLAIRDGKIEDFNSYLMGFINRYSKEFRDIVW
ncbi:hypothetical protein [Candidatus Vampirococcus lugosii]|uniref:Uncharacterized protein n=1 Tax=Candidatus Vampirococcus lugosii TaxID=2789015 RepID=A0ABS5QK57_9BACT|nr:hypothetical protein [Candidatus Vampirococcus lugosii]MBS8121482.1 hypothetical protein [Candidatus Vampirococcus lugosii]